MTTPAETKTETNHAPVFLIVLAALFCTALIGVAGYAKYQIDQNLYTIVTSASSEAFSAGKTLQNWTLFLTIASWSALVIATGLAVSLGLTFRKTKSTALQALSQSVANLAHGDLTTPIWGTERQDKVGDLARAMDLVRFHFSQLPDVSLLTDQGPVRLKFEGGAKTMFEAMMQQISSSADRVGKEASSLNEMASSQHKILSDLPLRLNAAIEQLKRNDQTNSVLMQRSVQGLADAHAQLEKLVPYIQKRAQGMAEITQIAGTQIASTLKDLSANDRAFRISADDSRKTVEQLASSANGLSERIFATLNLLQASNKLLNETTESSQGRLKQLVDTFGGTEKKLSLIVDKVGSRMDETVRSAETLSSLAEKTSVNAEQVDNLIQSMITQHNKLTAQMFDSTKQLDDITNDFGETKDAVREAVNDIRHDTSLLNEVFADLKSGHDETLSKINRTSETSYEVVQHLAECSQKLLQQIQEKVAAQTQSVQDYLATMALNSETATTQVRTAFSSLSEAQNTLETIETRLHETQSSFSTRLDTLGDKLENRVTETFENSRRLLDHNGDKLSDLANAADDAVQKLSILGQLTGTLGTVAGQLGQMIPTLSNGISPSAPTAQIDFSDLSEKLVHDFDERWKTSADQVESIRDDLADLIEKQKDRLEMRLVVLDRQVKTLSQKPDTTPMEIALLEDILSALETMSDHIKRIDPEEDLQQNHSDMAFSA